MSTVSTHVLDAAAGTPAGQVGVRLYRVGGPAGADELVWSAVTDADGRVAPSADETPGGLAAGTYRLVFATAEYFARTGTEAFYPQVSVAFSVGAERHYHVPLLLSPFAYSTYRGS